MLASILFEIICLSLMKMCILLGLDLNYILRTKVGNLNFSSIQRISEDPQMTVKIQMLMLVAVKI